MSAKHGKTRLETPELGERQRRLPVPDLTIHPVGRNATRRPGLLQLRLLRHFGLSSSTNLLEIGCGVGRLVYELADAMNEGSYEGFDIAPTAIEWLDQNYAPVLENFHFQLVKAENRRYNPRGKVQASSVVFPYESRRFDMVCAFSVFTHMMPDDIARYLVEVERVLRLGGRGVLTFFAMGEDDRDPALGTGERFVPLPGVEGAWTTSLEVPERAIAFRDAMVRESIASAGLRLVGGLRGSWRVAGSSETGAPSAATGPHFHKDVFVVEPNG